MKLTDEQKERVALWADEEEITLSEVQKRLKAEFGVSVTYLETRFLLEDHGIVLRSEVKPDENEAAEAMPAGEDDDFASDPDDSWEAQSQPGAGKVSVSLDSITQPHAMVSGKVSFSDGQSAQWYVDQMGRLGLDPATPGYRPSEQDIMAFQRELHRVMSGA